MAKKAGDKLISGFVRAAQFLGLLPGDDGVLAERLIGEHADISSQDLIVREGLLTTDEAARVACAQKELDISSYVDDQFKRANDAVLGAHKAAARVVRVTREPA